MAVAAAIAPSAAGDAVLVEGVRGDAVLGDAVHRPSVRICSSTRWLPGPITVVWIER